MNFLKDVYNFISYLTFVDIFFFVAIITLLILIVTLIYFIKINNDVLNDNDNSSKGNSEKIKKNYNSLENDILNIIENSDQEEIKKNDSLDNVEEYNDEEEALLDLESLTKKLQTEQSQKEVSITAYEKDQEEKAIISYDELLKKRNKYAINYEKEEVFDDLVVKKVNLHDLENKNEIEEIKEIKGVRVISYTKEEAFLSALKELNKLLN